MAENLYDKLNGVQLLERKVRLKKAELIEKSFHSTDPNVLLKANEMLKVDERDESDRKSYIFDPNDFNGGNGFKDKPIALSYDTLRRISYSVPVIRSIINTRIDQICSFCEMQRDKYSTGFIIRKKRGFFEETDEKPTTEEIKKINYIKDFILNCGKDSNFEGHDFDEFTRMVLNDSLTFDQLCFEVIRDRRGRPFSYVPVDGATMRIADTFDDDCNNGSNGRNSLRDGYGFRRPMTLRTGAKKIRGYYPSYVQVNQNVPVCEFYPWELCFGIRNPTTSIYSNGYGVSEIETLVNTITSLLWADEYNRRFFSQGSSPKGFIKIKNSTPTAGGGNLGNSRLNEFKQKFQSMMSGVGNCIAGDTIIYTTVGKFEIEKYLSGKSEKPVKIWTGQKFEDGLVYKTIEKKNLIETICESGVKIKTSADHKFLICDDKGDFVWKVQRDLKVGDWVVINKNPYELNQEYFYKGKKVEKDLIEILGWIAGDGNIGDDLPKKRKLTLYFHHEKELDILAEYYKILKKYNIKAKYKVHVRSEAEIERIKSKYGFKSVARLGHSINIIDCEFHNWFIREMGFNSSKQGKIIPNSIFKLDKQCRAAFLRGLFSADGSRMQGYSAALSIAHDNLRKDTCDLLMSLGIRFRPDFGHGKITKTEFNKTYTRKHEGSKIEVKDGDLFYQLIGFKQEHKQHVGYKAEGSKTEKIPASLCKKYLNGYRSFLNKQHRKNQLTSIIKVGCTKNTFINYIDELNLPIPEFTKDLHFEKITKIIDHKNLVQMYDVQVNDHTHAFVGNGLILHNSHKTMILEADADWVDLQKTNREMEFSHWIEFLIKICCAIWRIDPAEINFPLQGGADQKTMFEGNNEARLKHSKDKGLRPLLKFYERKLNKYIVSQIDPAYELVFMGVEDIDPSKELENDVKQATTFVTVDEIRVKRGMKPLGEGKGGDIVLNSIWLQWYNQKMQQEQAAQQQQGGEQGEDQSGEGAPMGEDQFEPGVSGSEQDQDEENQTNAEGEDEEGEDPFSKAFNQYFSKMMETEAV